MKRLMTLTLAATLLAGATSAKPALRDVAEIDNSLMMVAIADELRKECGDLDARMLKALGYLETLKSRARSLGYSNDEIEEYVTSKSEKTRMRAKATGYLESLGVNPADEASFCAYGRKEIEKGTLVGSLLRAR
ncbi:DUF5333 domain-containing protein [Mesobacterium pallidum]|uniref:DUF5333 domain-containing protein n=1 Tax=Mesobacterium pallidum TaxID=2872037 RepID=UPI001EE38EF0|nr:DUF5333 domain-containing protein [Mesobacterium pallidum]